MSPDQRAIADLYKEFGPVVYRRCLRVLSDREQARDATQEVFVKLLKHRERFSDRESAVPWIFGVATNHCLNLLRDARRHGEQVAVSDFDQPSEPKAASLADRQLGAAVLARADEATRAMAVAVLVDGRERQEVADELGVSRKTVTRKLDRFLDNARKFLARSDA